MPGSREEKSALGVPPGWVRRLVDRAIQNAKLIIRASNIYVDSLSNKDDSSFPSFPNDLGRPGVFGEIHVADGSTAQSIPTGTTYTKIDGFTQDGFGSALTPDFANDKIIMTRTGFYLVNISISFQSGSPNITFRAGAFLGGAEQHNVHMKRKVAAANDSGAMSGTGIIDVTTANTDLDMRIRHDDGGSINFIPEYMCLNVSYLGET